MDTADLEKIAELLRQEDVSFVRQAIELIVMLPLYSYQSDEECIVPGEGVSEIFTEGEQRWLYLVWLGHALATDQHFLEGYNLIEVLDIDDEELYLASDLPILPDCWGELSRFEGEIVLILEMPRLRVLPDSLATVDYIERIDLKAGTVVISDKFSHLDIRFAMSEWEFNTERLEDDWSPGSDFFQWLNTDREWLNWEMISEVWSYDYEYREGYGESGRYMEAHRIGTREVLLLSIDYTTISNLHPPTFSSFDAEVLEGTPAEALGIGRLQHFEPDLPKIPRYPHAVGQLSDLIPTPRSMDSLLESALQTDVDSKESYRQKMLKRLSELEQQVQAAKQTWTQW